MLQFTMKSFALTYLRILGFSNIRCVQRKILKNIVNNSVFSNNYVLVSVNQVHN